MKERNIVRTVFFFATLLLALVAAAQDRCSANSVAGRWGYSETGTVYTPSGPIAYSSLGTYTLDSSGNYSGSRTASAGGAIQAATFTGTATVNSDCTGTVTINFYNPTTGDLLNTVTKNLVYINKSTEARALATSVMTPTGASIQTVLTTDAKKMFPGKEQ